MSNNTARQEAGIGPQGSYFKPNTMRNARWQFVGVLSAITVARHYEITGDAELAARAGARAVARWLMFFICGICFNLLGAAVILFLTVPVWVARIVHEPQESGVTQSHVTTSLILLALLIAIYLATIPYTIGALAVRNADRSLFRVNHLGVYRWHVPFAYRMRRFPDWALYGLPFLLVFPLSWVLTYSLGG